jgi:hypothetical protein
MKNWFEENKLEIILGVFIALVVIAAVVFCILAVVNGWGGDFNATQWIINPANPASPVGKVYYF